MLLIAIAVATLPSLGHAQTSVGFNINAIEVSESLFTASLWVGRLGDLSGSTTVEITLRGTSSAVVQEDFHFEPLFNPDADEVEPDRLVLTLGPNVTQLLTSVTILPDTSSQSDRVFHARLNILSGAQTSEGKFQNMRVTLIDDDVPGADLATDIVSSDYADGGQGEAEFYVRNISADDTTFEDIVLTISTTAPVAPCATDHPTLIELTGPFTADNLVEFLPELETSVDAGALERGQTAGYRLCYFRSDGSLPIGDQQRPPDGAYTFSSRVTASNEVDDTRPDNNAFSTASRSALSGCQFNPFDDECCVLQSLWLSLGGVDQARDEAPLGTAGLRTEGAAPAPSRSARPGWWLRLVSAPGRFLESAQDLVTLYRFRDTVLSRSPGGRRATELYYRHSDALRDLVLANTEVRDASLDLLETVRPHLRALTDDRGDELIVTSTVVDALRDYFDLLEQRTSGDLRAALIAQRPRLDFDAAVGATVGEAIGLLDALSCVGSERALCLGDRFQVEVRWADFARNAGNGAPQLLTADTGAFWFFDDQNLELMVKALDATGINGHWWIFFGALSNVEYRVVVTDTVTGRSRTYDNGLGVFGSGGDTQAFPSSGSRPPAAADDGVGVRLMPLRANALPFAPAADVGDRQAQPRNDAAPMGSCAAEATTLCLSGGRFAVEVDWTDFAGNSGVGRRVDLTDDTGAFWFFDDQNLELMIKVLDGTAINGRWWVFYGSLSNVEYRLRVSDTVTGEVATYDNSLGTFASEGDTDALDG